MDGSCHADDLRVLCVDDHRDAADMLGLLLHISGYHARVCYSSREALELLEEFKPHACILDVQMPEMDGVELAHHIRAWAGNRPITLVAVTGLDDDRTRWRTADAGFDLHLTKPADPDKLAILLADIVIRQNQSTDEADRSPHGE